MSSLLERAAVWQLQRAGFEHQEVETEHGRMGALVYDGDGPLPPMALLHGIGSRGSHYRPLANRLLSRASRIVLPDFLAHGFSEIPGDDRLHIATLVDAMTEGLDHFLPDGGVVFGNSMGGYGALKYAARRPDRVRGLFVTSPAGGALPDDRRDAVLSRFRVDTHDDAAELVARGMTRVPRPLAPAVARVLHQQLSRPHVRTLLDRMDPQADLVPHELSALAMPVRVVWGSGERLLDITQLQWLRQHLPRHAVIDTPDGYGHAAYFEQPDDLTRRLVEFAAELDGGRGWQGRRIGADRR